PTDITVKATQGAHPNLIDPSKALQRYWTLTASSVTADLTFNYLATDVPGTANENNFSIFKYSGVFSQPGGSVNAGTHTATISGVSSVSDWPCAEPSAVVTPSPSPTPTPSPTNPSGTGSANPSSVLPGGSTLFTVNVTPGANPNSSNLAVTADLSSIGGS